MERSTWQYRKQNEPRESSSGDNWFMSDSRVVKAWRPDTSESRMWVYSSTKRTDIQLRCFEYRKSRSGKWARNFLEGFSGVLITDGYSGYQQPGRKRHPPFCRWPEGMALCRYTPGCGGECNHLFADGNGKSQQPAAGWLSASSAQHTAWSCGAEQGLWGWWSSPMVRRNEVVVLGSVSAGNHGFSVSVDLVLINRSGCEITGVMRMSILFWKVFVKGARFLLL